MKKNKIVGILVLFLALSSFTVWHRFYVSVTQIDYNQNKNRIEISIRIFIDDLEKALEKKYNKKLYLATSIENSKSSELIEEYLFEKLQIKVNNKLDKLVFLGIEYESDVIICYVKVSYSKKISNFEVYNSVLTEIYSEQQNIVHTKINNETNSFLLTKGSPKQVIKY